MRELGENMSRYPADRILSAPTIEVLTHSEVRELVGEGWLETVVVEDLDHQFLAGSPQVVHMAQRYVSSRRTSRRSSAAVCFSRRS